MKPVLLVDVDGVISVFGPGIHDGPERSPLGGLDLALEVYGRWTRVPRGMGARFQRLEQAFECVWATTWEGDAPAVFGAQLGIGRDWPVIRFFLMGRTRTYKLAQIEQWCDEHAVDRPVAWVDDDLAWDADAWAEHRGQTLLVRTELDQGLTDGHVERLLRWAERLAGERGG